MIPLPISKFFPQKNHKKIHTPPPKFSQKFPTPTTKSAPRFINDTQVLVTKEFAKNARIFGTPEYKLWRAINNVSRHWRCRIMRVLYVMCIFDLLAKTKMDGDALFVGRICPF